MSKLKMKVAVFEKAIAVQILEMDERFRGSFNNRNAFTASNGFAIKSRTKPEFMDTYLYLWGDHNEADKQFMVIENFQDNTERDTCLFKMRQALTEWAEKWEGWGDKKGESAIPESDVWEFK